MKRQSKAVIIPGGPGLSPSYLHPYLDDIFSLHQQSYVDPSKARTAQEASELVTKSFAGLGENDVVFAHSWGSYLVLEAIKKRKAPPCHFILANPVPLSGNNLPLVLKALTERMTPETLQKVEAELRKKGKDAGAEAFRLALRAYTGHAGRLPQLEFEFWPERESMVSRSQPGYSHKSLFNKINGRTLVLFGQSDYVTLTLFGGKPRHTQTLPGGHFGFAENPLAYKRAIINFLLKSGNA